MTSISSRWARLLVPLSLGGAGCASPPPPAASPGPPPAPAPGPVSRVGIADRAWGSEHSARFSLRVALPEHQDWQIEAVREAWWTARHAGSSSELSVKTWRTARLSRREDCLKQIALWRPKAPNPESEPATVVDRRMLEVPAGYQTELVVGVRRAGAGGKIEGYVLAVGHTIGQCYAALYTTHAFGTSAEATVGERLALFGDAVLPRIERVGIEERVR